MVMVMVAGLVSTLVVAMLLAYLVARFVSVVVGGGGGGGGVVGGGGGERRTRRRSGKRVRFDGVEERVVVDRFENVLEPSGSAAAAMAAVEGFVNDVERVESAAVKEEEISERSVDGRDESAVEQKLEAKERVQFEEVSGFAEVEEIGGVVEERDGGSGIVPVDADFIGLNEVVSCADRGRVGELIEEEEGGEAQAMDVEDADGGGEEMEEDLQDEVADRIEECIRNIEGGVIDERDSVNDGCMNEFEKTAEPKDVAVENIVNEGCKNEFEGMEEPKVVNVETKDEVIEERFGSSEEDDDDWEGIEMRICPQAVVNLGLYGQLNRGLSTHIIRSN